MPSPGGIPFSWPALLLAPWPTALAVGWVMCPPPPTGHAGFAWGGFLFMSAVTLAFAYAGTVALVLAVRVLSQFRPVNTALCAGLGLVLAAVGYAPLLWMSWKSSGPDSGPPDESFFTYVFRSAEDPISYLFLASGFVTALVYALLARRLTTAAPTQ